MSYIKNIAVTGGAGFIGSHLVTHLVHKYPMYKIHNIDVLTYAGNLENLKSIEAAENYDFHKVDIRHREKLEELLKDINPDGIIHLAAESHVDRSISEPLAFVETNVIGTVNLLNITKELWSGRDQDKLFYHVSTDEVYGSLGEEGLFTEETPYDPRSPYSASKASSDHFVRAYYHTYNVPIVISNCSNNYGPFQFPEKLIPLIINNIVHKRPLPVYGDGSNVRDWLWVGDHIEAIDRIFHDGKVGETYNIGGNNERRNIDLVHALCDICDDLLGRAPGSARSTITFVKDRPGHDLRYAIDANKIKNHLGWEPRCSVEEGLKKTIQWYLSNPEWLESVTSGNYQKYYQKQYG